MDRFLLHLWYGSSITPRQFLTCPTGGLLLATISGQYPHFTYAIHVKWKTVTIATTCFSVCWWDKTNIGLSKSTLHSLRYNLVSRFPNHFKDTNIHVSLAKQGEVLDHKCRSYSLFLMHQDELWPLFIYEISNNVCSYITYTKESSFGLDTSPVYSCKLGSICDIFQATVLHLSIDTRFVYHIQSYNRSIHP